ncbi:MAG: hypothetical protein ACI865_000546 [Flavobacteriaceae bacterium]|jgi:hypothetical protein
MIKFYLVVTCLALTNLIEAQTFRAGKPMVVNSYQVPTTEETGELAWYYPDRTPNSAVKFEKVEYGLSLPQSVGDRITAFLTQDESNGKGLNPFNRHAIDITATFYLNPRVSNGSISDLPKDKGSKVKVVDAFYYEEFRRDLAKNKWWKDTTSFPFRVRFSPEQVGAYTVELSIEINEVEIAKVASTFTVTSSESKGFLEQGVNKKHLRYSDTKKSFMGIGQVIPWAVYEDWYHTDKASGPVKFMPMYKSFRSLSEAGGNFTRMVAAPWFMQLEWEALGNYQPKMGQAWEFDRMNERCKELDIYYIFCGLLHSPLESHPDGHGSVVPGISWESYCYNNADDTPSTLACEPGLSTSKPVDFYGDPTANDHQKNYFRYLVSRWGYSTSLAGWQLMSEADQTCAYRDIKLEDGTLVDNLKNRKKVTDWTGQMVDFMKDECGDEHPKSISIITGQNFSNNLWDHDLFKHENVSFFGLHDYVFEMEPASKNIRNRNLHQRYESVNNLNTGLVNGEIAHPEFQKNMFIYDEFGHVPVIPRMIPEDQYVDPVVTFNNCADFSFKQDLWFTFSSGCAVAGLDWWNEHEPKRHDQWVRYFPGLVSFAKNIDFEGVNYTEVRERKGEIYIAQRWPLTRKAIDRSNQKSYKKSDKLEAYVQIDSLGQQGFGWMVNRSFHWANLIDSLDCLADLTNGTGQFHKPYLLKPIDNDLVDSPITIEENQAFIRIYNLQRKSVYTVVFYDTETGEIVQSNEVKSRGGTLKIYAPQMKPSQRYDLAFKFYVSELGWK